jgi:hypothetical protein
MRALVKLNLVAGVLFAAAQISFARTGDAILLSVNIAFLIGFFVLGVIDLVCIFTLWKRHRTGAFLPTMSYVLAAAIWLIGGGYGTRLALYGTPSEPDSFLRGETRTELTEIGQHLLGNGFKTISLFPGHPSEVHMIVDRPSRDVAPEIISKLQKYGFQRVQVDDFQQTVEFDYNHLRTWHDYIWAKNGLSRPYTTLPIITAADIAGWQALITITKEGRTRGKPNTCDPGIGYFYLKDALGEEMVNRIGGYRSSAEITDAEKEQVMSALNKQVLASSALAEQPQITYEQTLWLGRTEMELHISGGAINDGFWVVRLLKNLLLRGVVSFAPDGRHLKIKADLTDAERHQVEWLHVGIMRFVYSNLLEKEPFLFSRELGSNWCFEEE